MTMKRWISAVMVVALLVSVAPVLAGESFHALRQLPASLTPLDDAQLATVEGGDVMVLQSTNIRVSQSTPTSTPMHVSQNTTIIHTDQAEWLWMAAQGNVTAAQQLTEWLWVAAQGNVTAAQ